MYALKPRLNRAKLISRFVSPSALIIVVMTCVQLSHGQSPVDLSAFCDQSDCATKCGVCLGFGDCDVCRTGKQIRGYQDQSCPPNAPSASIGSLAWTKGPWQITPYGFLSGEAIAASASLTARPFVLFVNNDIGTDENQFTVHGQTTAIGVDVKGPRIGSLQAGGNVLINFLGDRPIANQSTPFLLRAYGDLKNEDWRLGFGVAPDIFGARTPTTVNFGGHLQSGNIAAFRGQFRLERYFQLSDNVRWTTIGALSQQVVTDFVNDRGALGTDNGWPNIEGRVLLGIGERKANDSPFEIGAAYVIGETRAIGLTDRNVSSTWGISFDGLIDMGRWGASFEAFTGEAIGTYNAAIGQSLNPEDGEAIATVGGFAEMWCKPVDCLTWHIGYGTDDPNNQDLGQIRDNLGTPIAGQKSRNTVYWTNLMWNVTDFFHVDFEVSHRETDYIAPSVSNDAMVYHFRSRLIF